LRGLDELLCDFIVIPLKVLLKGIEGLTLPMRSVAASFSGYRCRKERGREGEKCRADEAELEVCLQPATNSAASKLSPLLRRSTCQSESLSMP